MTHRPPLEGPEHRTQTLSPVSPKPLYFPSPANIPILEKSMDPDFDESTAQVGEALDDQAKLQDGHSSANASSYPHHVDINSPGEADGTVDNLENTMQDSIDAYEGNQAAHQSLVENRLRPQPKQPLDTSMTNSSIDMSSPFQRKSSHLSAPEPSQNAMATDDAFSPNVSTSGGQAVLANSHNEQGPSPTLGEEAMAGTPANGGGLGERGGGGGAGGVDYQSLLDSLSASAGPQATGVANAGTTDGSAVPMTGTADLPFTQLNAEATQPPLLGSGPLPQGFANLPPRPPPPQETSGSHQLASDSHQYQFTDPYSNTQKSAASALPLSSASYLPPPGNVPPPLLTAGAPGTTSASNGLGPPPIATFQQQQGDTAPANQPNSADPNYRQREPLVKRASDDEDRKEDEDLPWGAEVQKLYDSFLQDERMFVTEGQWDKFPTNSRLFIGNLPTEKVTKRDLFHVFHKHGRLAQISIKQAYGFIQYLDAASCYRALTVEQGVAIRGRKIHLEISKPQKSNNKNSGGNSKAQQNRRSRSPDYTKGGTSGGNNGGGGGGGGSGGGGGGGGAQRADRYRGTGNNRQRDKRERDDYRPGRSPSPRARGNRNDFRRERSSDRYNGRRRSRSRSPRGRNRHQNSQPRSKFDDDCPLPRRDPAQVPDVQIIAKGDLDRAFIGYVEKAFNGRGIRSDVLILSPRLDESAVMRRQILEGVIAVMKLDKNVQMSHQFQLSIFDRSAGEDKVKFEEYNNLALNICVELVLRAKQIARPPAAIAASVYGLPISQSAQQQQQQQQRTPQQSQTPLSLPHNHPFSPTQQVTPSLNSPFDTSSLQKLLGRAQQQGQTPQQQLSPASQFSQQGPLASATDLSRLLASANSGRANQAYQMPSQTVPQQQQQYQNFANNSALSGLLANLQQHQQQQQQQQQRQQQQQQQQNSMHQRHGSGAMHSQPQSPPQASTQHPHQQQQQQPDMQSIMAQLASYGSR